MKPLQVTFAALISVLFASALWSCNKDKTPTEQAETRSTLEQPSAPTMPSGMPSNSSGMMDQLRAGCPMVVQGAAVTVADTESGVALTFTTDAGDLADLRTRVQHMAQMYEMHHGQAGMMWHHMGREGMAHRGSGMGGHNTDQMAGRGPMPAASTTVTDTDLGPRLELRPTDPSQLDALREHVRWHQQRMHSGECWILQGQSAATPHGEQE